MRKKELKYFTIEDSFGGNQDWFTDPMMNRGGCGAVTACDTCMYFSKYYAQKHLYPFDIENLTKEKFIEFSNIMKPFLSPRRMGINTLELYMDGFQEYLNSVSDTFLGMRGFLGTEKLDEAEEKVIEQIEKGFPISYLNLLHQDKSFEDYEWHWFSLIGYEKKEENFFVKAVSYGKVEWLDFKKLWNTGHKQKGGMVLYFLLKR